MNISMKMNAAVVIVLVGGMLLLGVSMAGASVFDTIDFETSEGYATPATLAGTASSAMENIGTGGDFTDTNYGASTHAWMLVWNGIHSDGTNYGVPSGQSAFFFDGNSRNCWTRTSPMAVPDARKTDRYFTIDYSSLVTFATANAANNHAPPYVQFWFNSATTTPYIEVHHTWSGDTNGKYNIGLKINGTTYRNIGVYQYRQWADNKLVVDRILGTVNYYYNGTSLGSYNIGTMASFQTYGVSYNYTQYRGQMATDNIRFGTIVPEPGSLALLAAGLTGLISVVRRRRR